MVFQSTTIQTPVNNIRDLEIETRDRVLVLLARLRAHNVRPSDREFFAVIISAYKMEEGLSTPEEFINECLDYAFPEFEDEDDATEDNQ